MQRTLLRSFRKTVDALARTVVHADNVAKTFAIGDWSVPFQWILDHDALALDANSQRSCVVSPEIAEALEVAEVNVEQRHPVRDEVKVDVIWKPTAVTVTAPPHSTACVAPSRSSVVVRSSSTEARVPLLKSRLGEPGSASRRALSESFLTSSPLVWEPKDLPQQSPNTVPPAVVVKDFLSNPASKKRDVMHTIEVFGFAVVEDASLQASESTATSSVDVVKIRCSNAERIILDTFSILRHSHYGAMSTWSDGDAWKEESCTTTSFAAEYHHNPGGERADVDASYPISSSHPDGAYMSTSLDLHTDCTYFVDCPKVQAFGCIFTTPRTFGGESTLADGLYAAKRLFHEDINAFHLLSRVPVGGRYKKEGRWYESYRPVITLRADGCKIETISFNNSDRIALDADLSAGEMRDFYAAYYKFHKLVHDNSIRFLLKPGQLLAFDNHRVLHGRLQFSGPRVMCGAYIASDEYYSALRCATMTSD